MEKNYYKMIDWLIDYYIKLHGFIILSDNNKERLEHAKTFEISEEMVKSMEDLLLEEGYLKLSKNQTSIYTTYDVTAKGYILKDRGGYETKIANEKRVVWQKKLINILLCIASIATALLCVFECVKFYERNKQPAKTNDVGVVHEEQKLIQSTPK